MHVLSGLLRHVSRTPVVFEQTMVRLTEPCCGSGLKAASDTWTFQAVGPRLPMRKRHSAVALSEALHNGCYCRDQTSLVTSNYSSPSLVTSSSPSRCKLHKNSLSPHQPQLRPWPSQRHHSTLPPPSSKPPLRPSSQDIPELLPPPSQSPPPPPRTHSQDGAQQQQQQQSGSHPYASTQYSGGAGAAVRQPSTSKVEDDDADLWEQSDDHVRQMALAQLRRLQAQHPIKLDYKRDIRDDMSDDDDEDDDLRSAANSRHERAAPGPSSAHQHQQQQQQQHQQAAGGVKKPWAWEEAGPWRAAGKGVGGAGSAHARVDARLLEDMVSELRPGDFETEDRDPMSGSTMRRTTPNTHTRLDRLPPPGLDRPTHPPAHSGPAGSGPPGGISQGAVDFMDEWDEWDGKPGAARPAPRVELQSADLRELAAARSRLAGSSWQGRPRNKIPAPTVTPSVRLDPDVMSSLLGEIKVPKKKKMKAEVEGMQSNLDAWASDFKRHLQRSSLEDVKFLADKYGIPTTTIHTTTKPDKSRKKGAAGEGVVGEEVVSQLPRKRNEMEDEIVAFKRAALAGHLSPGSGAQSGQLLEDSTSDISVRKN